MNYITKYKLFENKFFRNLSEDDYTQMVRQKNIVCFNSMDIKFLSNFFNKKNIDFRFENASLLPLGSIWSITGDPGIDIDISEDNIVVHLTDNKIKKFDLNQYRGLSYDEIDKMGESEKYWFTLENFSLVIPGSGICCLKCYEEYYILDALFTFDTDKVYLCDQLEGLIKCLETIY